MKRILAIIAAGAVSYGITKLATRPTQTESVQWIDGEDHDVEETDPLPMFWVGDEVNLYNPYEGMHMIADNESLEPERFVIDGVEFDSKDGVYRYSFEGEVDENGEKLWYSEEWLSLPVVSRFVTKKVLIPENIVEGAITMIEKAIESEVLSRQLDEDLRNREIDRFLAVYRNGTTEEREAAEKELRRITEGGD